MRQYHIVSALILLSGCQFIPGTDAAKIHEAKRYASEHMRDPESAKFRNMRLSMDEAIVCGEINAKNAYGAYAGYQRFLYMGGAATLAPAETLTARDVRSQQIPCIEEQVKQSLQRGDKADLEMSCLVAQQAETRYQFQNEFEAQWAACLDRPRPVFEKVEPLKDGI